MYQRLFTRPTAAARSGDAGGGDGGSNGGGCEYRVSMVGHRGGGEVCSASVRGVASPHEAVKHVRDLFSLGVTALGLGWEQFTWQLSGTPTHETQQQQQQQLSDEDSSCDASTVDDSASDEECSSRAEQTERRDVDITTDRAKSEAEDADLAAGTDDDEEMPSTSAAAGQRQFDASRMFAQQHHIVLTAGSTRQERGQQQRTAALRHVVCSLHHCVCVCGVCEDQSSVFALRSPRLFATLCCSVLRVALLVPVVSA